MFFSSLVDFCQNKIGKEVTYDFFEVKNLIQLGKYLYKLKNTSKGEQRDTSNNLNVHSFKQIYH